MRTLEDLLADIRSATDPDWADELRAEAAKLATESKNGMNGYRTAELRAERKWGELLGPAPGHGPGRGKRSPSGDLLSRAEINRRSKARSIAPLKIPNEVFEDYIDEAERKNKMPTRSGLLRAVAGSPPKLTQEQIDKAVAAGLKKGKTHEQIARELGISRRSNPMTIAVLRATGAEASRSRSGRARSPVTGKTSPGRQKELKEARKLSESQAYLELLKVCGIIAQLSGVLEGVHMEDYQFTDNFSETAVWTASDTLDDLESLSVWVDRAIPEIKRWLGDDKVRERIRKLRNVTGRSAEETAAYLELAKKYERQLTERLASA